MVVDDEREIVDLLTDYLTAEGYRVIPAYNSQEAIDIARKHNPELVVLDIMMPGVGGFEVCRALRAESSMPILMLSAKQEEVDKILALGLGADDYVTKPFSPKEVVARVKAQLRRVNILSQAGNNRILRFGDLEIDTEGYTVSCRGKLIDLSAKEFELLKFLALNPNRVFSKEQLFERVWGENFIGDANTVMVHIRRLREKIEADPGKPVYIKTIWGAGYKFGG